VDVLARLDRARADLDVLRHPFYRRWSAGELSAQELSRYAGQYRHAVVALAQASERAARDAGPRQGPSLREHAREEAAHVELWERFARAASAQGAGAGEGPAEDPLPETRACARAWSAGQHLLEHLAVLYAIEAGQPDVSRTKLEGLAEHYGYSPEGPALEYFRVHAVRDREHARQARELIEQLLASPQDVARCAERMEHLARMALRGNWRLLDGVQAAASSTGSRAPGGLRPARRSLGRSS
jgi:pyrroloquinoline quinone (PQQ) biosynthesis protein C